MSFDSDTTQFQVVINAEEQYSIWPDYKALPAGWTAIGFSGDTATCLSHIQKAWNDLRPLSLSITTANLTGGLYHDAPVGANEAGARAVDTPLDACMIHCCKPP